MSLKTAAAVVDYIKEMEAACSAFYEKAGNAFEEPFFFNLAKENLRYQKRVLFAYRSSVTDILETGFGFKDMKKSISMPDDNALRSLNETLAASLELEKAARDFYATAAVSCSGLLDDVARSLNHIAKQRSKRAEAVGKRMERPVD